MLAHRQKTQLAPEPVVLVAPVGPYTAPLTELIWALFRHRRMSVVEAYVVVDRGGLEYLRTELLDSGKALDQLRRALGPRILDHHDMHTRVARLPGGEIVADDLDPKQSSCLRETLWNAARDAIAAAGDRRVIFGLTSGTRRTTTAFFTSFFQLLASKEDLLVDVRVTDRRVDRETDFFFPEQQERWLTRGHSQIDAMRVGVELIELDLPRLAGVLEGNVLTDYDSALQAAHARPASSPPPLVLDLGVGHVTIDGEEIDLSIAERFWYAYLAWRRGESTDGWVLAGQGGHASFLAFLERTGAHRFAKSIRTKPLRRLLDGEFVHDEDLRNLRGKTVQRLKKWCGRNRPELTHLLVPESDGNGHQRIPLPANRIEIRGVP